MLTKESKALLKLIVELSDYNEEKKIAINLNSKVIYQYSSKPESTVNISDYSKRIHGILQQLENEGCIKVFINRDTFLIIGVTYYGFHYQYVMLRKIAQSLIENLIWPIIAAVVASILTTLFLHFIGLWDWRL